MIAQSKATITGFVVSNTGQKIIGADVSVRQDKYLFYATSDASGSFLIVVPTGEVIIEVNRFGYESKTFDIEIKKDQSFSFTLEEDSATLKEVLISNNSKKAITTFSSGKLSFNPQKMVSIPSVSGTTDIVKLLQLTPGVQNSGDANGYLYVRGSDPGHNLMLYADTPIYGMAHLLGVFPFYNADHIEEVQFDKSNSDAKNGGRLSSTVFVIPYKQIPTKFSIQGNLGLLASQLTVSFPINDKTGLYISGRKTYIDEIIAPLFNSKKENANSDVQGLKYGFSDGNLTFISKNSKNSQVTIDAFMSSDKLQIKDSNLALNANLKWSNSAVSTAWRYAFSDKITLTNSFFITRYSNELQMEQASIQMNISSYVQDLGYRNAIGYSWKNVPFETGLQYTLHEVQPQKIEISNLSASPLGKQAENNKTNNLAVFTSAKPKLGEKLDAEFGLRLNYYSSGTKSSAFLHIEPRVVVTYSPKESLSFYVSYTRQNQYLNLITTSSVGIPTDFWIASSEGIPSQSSDAFSIGYNQKITKQFNTTLNSFYRSMNHLIEYPYGVTQFNEMTTLKNDLLIGDGKAYGLEWMLKKDSGKFKGWLSYTLSWSDRRFDALNEGNRYYAKYDRRHNLAIVGTYDFNIKWNVGLTQFFSSGNRFTMPTSWYFINNNPVKEYGGYNNAQMPNYIRTDVAVNYFFMKTAKKESALNFSISNTFNIQNPIYVVLNVSVDKNKDNIAVQTEKKTLYTILPSLSWRFKF